MTWLERQVDELVDKLVDTNISELEKITHKLTVKLEEKPVIEFTPKRNVIFVGDLHGDYESLLTLSSLANDNSLVFLGDYVDRGLRQLECLIGVLLLKLKKPRDVIVLRGNHETLSMNAYYGFIDELRRRFPDNWRLIYNRFINKVYVKIPLAAIVNLSKGRIFSCHGGPPITRSLEELYNVKLELEPEDEVVLEVLWSDPREELTGIAYSPRGAGYLYGEDVVKDFLRKYKFNFIVRAHEPVNGVLKMFNGMLYVVFTCRYYGIHPSVLKVDHELNTKIIHLE